MRAKPLTSIVSVAFVLAMGACGNDDNGEENVATTPESTASETAESTSGKGNTAPAETPEELAACLEKAGYAPTVIPAPPEGVPGAEFGSLGSVRVNLSPRNGVVAVFLEDAKKAKDLSKGIGKSVRSGRGTVEIIGAVYLAANQGRPKELKTFRTCLEG
jgi:hypothetical protein